LDALEAARADVTFCTENMKCKAWRLPRSRVWHSKSLNLLGPVSRAGCIHSDFKLTSQI